MSITVPNNPAITVSGKRRWQLPGFITHKSSWLALYALILPVLGYVPVAIFTLASPGSRWSHLAVGTLTCLTAFIIGCFVGFLFATPRVVSAGQLKAAGVTLGSNLAEVSDWLTKLLLGAALVQLTHLGAPIGSLIDHVALGLQNPSATGGPTSSAKVMAGLIIFGYAFLGLLEGYVVTSVWYPQKLISLAGAVNQLQQAGTPNAGQPDPNAPQPDPNAPQASDASAPHASDPN